MLNYMESIHRGFVGAGTLQIVPHKDVEEETLKEWAKALKDFDIEDTAHIISTAFKRMNAKDFQSFMTVWTEDHNSDDTGYIVEYNDEYYGNLLFIGFNEFNNVVYYVWEV